MAKCRAAINLSTMLAVTKVFEVGERSKFEITKSFDSAFANTQPIIYVGMVKLIILFIDLVTNYKLLI